MARISKIYRILISALLALLGFSCGRRDQVNEYGTPSATYKAKGVVVSEADNSPIENIRAVLNYEDWPMDIDIQDTHPWVGHTDSKGFFSLELHGFPRQKLYVELIDVDGEANGSFAGMKVEADFTNATFTGGSGHWYEGEAEIDLKTIKMKPEDKPE